MLFEINLALPVTSYSPSKRGESLEKLEGGLGKIENNPSLR